MLAHQLPSACLPPSSLPPSIGAKELNAQSSRGSRSPDEQPASLKITGNARLLSASSPILDSSGWEVGRRRTPSLWSPFHVEILCQSCLQSGKTIRPSAGFNFCLFPKTGGAVKKKNLCFYIFMSGESRFATCTADRYTTSSFCPSTWIRWKCSWMSTSKECSRSAAE